MNKNFMNMMQTQPDDSSDEERPQQAPRKMSKKESRAENQRVRDNYGPGNYKESSQRYNERSRGGRGRGRGRQYDRHSGTGRQAFGGGSRRGGHGKGNLGTMADQIEDAKKGDVTLGDDPSKAPEPVKEEKIVDLDDYMKEKGLSLKMKSGEEQKELADPKNFEDENTIAVSYKKKTVGNKKMQKKKDEVVLGGTLMTEKKGPHRRHKKKNKKKKNELTDADFPALC